MFCHHSSGPCSGPSKFDSVRFWRSSRYFASSSPCTSSSRRPAKSSGRSNGVLASNTFVTLPEISGSPHGVFGGVKAFADFGATGFGAADCAARETEAPAITAETRSSDARIERPSFREPLPFNVEHPRPLRLHKSPQSSRHRSRRRQPPRSPRPPRQSGEKAISPLHSTRPSAPKRKDSGLGALGALSG